LTDPRDSETLIQDPSDEGDQVLRRRRRVWSFFAGLARVFFFVCLACLTLWLGFGSGLYYIVSQKTPSIEEIRNYEPPAVTQIFAEEGQLIGRFYYKLCFPVTLEEMPKALRDAFVVAECGDFWKSDSIAWRTILSRFARLFDANLRAKAVPCRKVFSVLWPPPMGRPTFFYLLRESLVINRIENALTKEEILTRFLNRVYLGDGAYGVEAAARTYFGRHAKDLTIAQCATIVGMIMCPSYCSPKRHLEKALERRNWVLGRLYDDGYISRQEYDNAMQEELKVVEAKDEYHRAPEPLLEAMRRYLGTKYGTDPLYKGGLRVYTSLHFPLTEDSWNPTRPPEEYITRVLDRHGKVLGERHQ
jgi:penicillin-binding protein 1A